MFYPIKVLMFVVPIVEEKDNMYYLITVNCNGTISYMNKGSYRQMKKLEVHSFHRVTSIGDYDKAVRKYGINS